MAKKGKKEKKKDKKDKKDKKNKKLKKLAAKSRELQVAMDQLNTTIGDLEVEIVCPRNPQDPIVAKVSCTVDYGDNHEPEGDPTLTIDDGSGPQSMPMVNDPAGSTTWKKDVPVQNNMSYSFTVEAKYTIVIRIPDQSVQSTYSVSVECP